MIKHINLMVYEFCVVAATLEV